MKAQEPNNEISPALKNPYLLMVLAYLLFSLVMGADGYSQIKEPSAPAIFQYMTQALISNLFPLTMVYFYVYFCDMFQPSIENWAASSRTSQSTIKKVLGVLFFLLYLGLGAEVFNLDALTFWMSNQP